MKKRFNNDVRNLHGSLKINFSRVQMMMHTYVRVMLTLLNVFLKTGPSGTQHVCPYMHVLPCFRVFIKLKP